MTDSAGKKELEDTLKQIKGMGFLNIPEGIKAMQEELNTQRDRVSVLTTALEVIRDACETAQVAGGYPDPDEMCDNLLDVCHEVL